MSVLVSDPKIYGTKPDNPSFLILVSCNNGIPRKSGRLLFFNPLRFQWKLHLNLLRVRGPIQSFALKRQKRMFVCPRLTHRVGESVLAGTDQAHGLSTGCDRDNPGSDKDDHRGEQRDYASNPCKFSHGRRPFRSFVITTVSTMHPAVNDVNTVSHTSRGVTDNSLQRIRPLSAFLRSALCHLRLAAPLRLIQRGFHRGYF